MSNPRDEQMNEHMTAGFFDKLAEGLVIERGPKLRLRPDHRREQIAVKRVLQKYPTALKKINLGRFLETLRAIR